MYEYHAYSLFSFPTNLGVLTFYPVYWWGFQFSFKKKTKTQNLLNFSFITFQFEFLFILNFHLSKSFCILHWLLFRKLLIYILIRYLSVSTCNLFCHFYSHYYFSHYYYFYFCSHYYYNHLLWNDYHLEKSFCSLSFSCVGIC